MFVPLQLSRTKESKTSSKKKDSSSSSQASPGSSTTSDKRVSGDSNRSGDASTDRTPSKSRDPAATGATQPSTATGSPGSSLANLHAHINNAPSPAGARMIAPSVIISPSSAPVCLCCSLRILAPSLPALIVSPLRCSIYLPQEPPKRCRVTWCPPRPARRHSRDCRLPPKSTRFLRVSGPQRGSTARGSTSRRRGIWRSYLVSMV